MAGVIAGAIAGAGAGVREGGGGASRWISLVLGRRDLGRFLLLLSSRLGLGLGLGLGLDRGRLRFLLARDRGTVGEAVES